MIANIMTTVAASLLFIGFAMVIIYITHTETEVAKERVRKSRRRMTLLTWETKYGTRNPLEAQILEHKDKYIIDDEMFDQEIEYIVNGVSEDPATGLPIYDLSCKITLTPVIKAMPLTGDEDDNILEER